MIQHSSPQKDGATPPRADGYTAFDYDMHPRRQRQQPGIVTTATPWYSMPDLHLVPLATKNEHKGGAPPSLAGVSPQRNVSSTTFPPPLSCHADLCAQRFHALPLTEAVNREHSVSIWSLDPGANQRLLSTPSQTVGRRGLGLPHPRHVPLGKRALVSLRAVALSCGTLARGGGAWSQPT